MTAITLRLAARCEAAGRPNNEDNYQINENLSEGKWGFATDAEIKLSASGALLVVADGMGGTNAGEVASALAIESIKEWFDPKNLARESFKYPSDIKSYIKKAIQAADRKIKEHGKKNPETDGMGSTIVLAWLINEYVYVGWCGDSRCYRFNPEDGFTQLSHDHSYVQELVDNGKLEPELAFEFPDRNIITRCLGDPYRKANPDIIEFPLHNGDVILLCSDGLSGVLQDREIEAVISGNAESMKDCRDALWSTSNEAGWDDNVTLALCRVVSGVAEEYQSNTVKIGAKEEKPPQAPVEEPVTPPAVEKVKSKVKVKRKRKKKRGKKVFVLLLWLFIIISLIGLAWFFRAELLEIAKPYLPVIKR
ncbi:MAG: protein phosphatase 2C domain-containing protein [Tannerellaceae bacterium]|jgi:protein phosphatase|nr:protein phosphatase 2C domain-containing protein [Tannerellaceae bacterium]